MKKRSRIVSLGVLALTLTMMSTCLMGSTMARYVTEVTGSATAVVAAWSFKADSKDSVGETFTEIYLGDTTHREAYDLKDIAEGVIAPGTKGSFDIVIDGAGSGVGIDYAVKIAAGKDVILPDDLVFSTEAITADKPGSKLDDFSPSGTIDYATGADSMKRLSLSTGNGRLVRTILLRKIKTTTSPQITTGCSTSPSPANRLRRKQQQPLHNKITPPPCAEAGLPGVQPPAKGADHRAFCHRLNPSVFH